MNDVDHSKANQMAELEAMSEAHTRQMSYLDWVPPKIGKAWALLLY